MDSDKLIEIWEANLEDSAEPGPNKFKGMYFQGYLTEVEITSSAEEMWKYLLLLVLMDQVREEMSQ